MKLLNARFGFATNSSSTHSIIIRPGLTDDLPDRGFNWENFTLTSKAAKNQYLAATLAEALGSWVPNWAMGWVVRQWLGVSEQELPDSAFEDLNIDHQSLWSLPRDRFEEEHYGNSPTWPSREFVADLQKFLLETPGLTILGGNDNASDDEYHPLKVGEFFNLPIKDIEGLKHLVARKDKRDGYWTIFNKITGTRLRFHFDPKAKVLERAWAPELIDLAITHYCDKNCKFCFADATPDGKHAEYENIRLILQALGNLGVFEVALGGGEPTLHPSFGGILQTAVYDGIVPNFSTRNLNWLLDKEIRELVIEKVGGFAVSCDTLKDVQQVVEAVERFPEVAKKVSIQLVFGTVSPWEWYHIMRTCQIHDWPVTILGFKAIGRGKSFKQIVKYEHDLPYPFIGRQKEDKLPRIGIDTSLAKDIAPLLQKMNVPSWLYSTKEGTHSMAIDAVTMVGAPSSFAPESERIKIEPTAESIGEAFRSWQNG